VGPSPEPEFHIEEEEHHLDGLPAPLLDMDFTPDGAWVGVAGDDEKQLVILGDREVRIPEPCRCPMVRAMGNDAAVVVERRPGPEGGAGARVVDASGDVRASFSAGDGIQDVFASDDWIVTTYFDEGVFGGIAPGHEGVAVFDAEGKLRLGYRSHFGGAAADVSDCYCACWAGRNRLAFLPYTDFPLVVLDLDTMRQEVRPTPPEVHGSRALAMGEGTVFLYAPYEEPHVILAWRPDGGQVRRVGRYTAALRGLPGGRFLARGDAGYTVISFTRAPLETV
jgi:hypothetical protein